MEVSMSRISSQAKVAGLDPVQQQDLGFCGNLNRRIIEYPKSNVCFGRSMRWRLRSSIGLAIKASANFEPIVSVSEKAKPKPNERIKLYVGMPMDAVSECNSINQARAISVGLRALKLLGVDGVEIPVWWGVAEKHAMGKYDWSGYISLVEMVEKEGLEVRISLNFHASREAKIALPDWVSKVGESQPGIFYTDKSGGKYRDCLSLGVDEIPVFDGMSPIQVYGGFCESFKSAFSRFLGSTITGITIGLGPDGELRYPSHHRQPKTNLPIGVGEFQCYDENMLNNLKLHAEASGNPLWGLSGPHDAPDYHHAPSSNSFVQEHGGSWEGQYGNFFLTWYSNQLISHGERLLSLATSAFSETGVEVSGKIPLVHYGYKTRSHPHELTSGFYNTLNRDGYEKVVEIFEKNSCEIILPGMDLSDKSQPSDALSSPESLLEQITASCKKRGVKLSGQNLSVERNGFERIKRSLLNDNNGVNLFIYQRMGAYFFSPEHFPKFTEFVRGLNQLDLASDDLAGDEDLGGAEPLHKQGKSLQMQEA